MPTIQMSNQLERLVDRHGISDVCDALAMICLEKADHVETNWQDLALAKDWQRYAAALQRVERAAKRNGL